MSHISILLPTYEPNPAHLREAMESILSQTEPDWSLFIHDDASTSDVRSIVEPYLTDPRIRFDRSDTRLGIGGNWNACLKHADAQYVQFLFQDDAWEPAYLERSSNILDKHPSVGFVSANHEYRFESPDSPDIYKEVQQVRSQLAEGKHNRWSFLQWWMRRGLRPNVLGEPSFVMLRRSLTDNVGRFNERMHQGLDFEYWIRCLLLADWYCLQESLGFFRVHAKGASAQHQRSWKGSMDRLRCFLLLLRRVRTGSLRRAALKGMAAYVKDALGRCLR